MNYLNPANRSAESGLGVSGIPFVTQASVIATGGTCQKVAVTTASGQSAAINGRLVHLSPTIDCYVREGADPTALSNGTDHFLFANATQPFRMGYGNKLAFISESGSGSVRIAVVG